MKRSLSYIIIGIFAAVSAFAQTDVKSYKGGETEGVTYYLPNTALDITIEAVEITRTPGEFAAYAGKYLHINNAITKEEKYWVFSSLKIKQTGVPNPQKMYTIQLVHGSTAANVRLTEDGILHSINTDAPEEKVPAKKETP